MTFKYKKQYIAGPRLLKELEGTAKMAVWSMTLQNPQWVSNPRGVYVLLDYLESIALPSLPEASRFVMKFCYGMQRRKGETMTSWITRHAEELWDWGECYASSEVQLARQRGIRVEIEA